MLGQLADRKTLHTALLYTPPPVGRALWILDRGLLYRRLCHLKKNFHPIRERVFINHVLICNYHAFKTPNANQKGIGCTRESQSKRPDYMEHWGVTLLLLYRAIACLAAPLQACSIPVTLIRSNFKGNHEASEKKWVCFFCLKLTQLLFSVVVL